MTKQLNEPPKDYADDAAEFFQAPPEPEVAAWRRYSGAFVGGIAGSIAALIDPTATVAVSVMVIGLISGAYLERALTKGA